MPKFLDNIEFYTEGYSAKTLTINKETVDVDLEKKSWNEEWSKWNDEGKVELEIPSETIKYSSEDPAKKKITDVSRDIEEKKDEAIYKIGALSGAGLNATNELVQMGLNAINDETQKSKDEISNLSEQSKTEITTLKNEADSLINSGKQDVESLTNQGLNELQEKIEDGLGQINELNLHNGPGDGSLQQAGAKYTGQEKHDGENVGLRTGDTIPGAIATGVQSFAIGGLRYDYASYNYIKINGKYYDVINLDPVTLQYKRDGEEGYIAPIQENDGKIFVEDISWGVSVNDKTVTLTNTQNGISIESSPYGGRTPTSAEGNQSFAVGGSSHAYGDWSVAMGKDVKAYQDCQYVVGRYNDNKWGNIFEIGNGSSDGDRKNAFEVRSDGRAKVQSAPVDDDDVVRLKELSVPTQEQVDLLF